MASRSLEDLHPEVKHKAEAFLSLCRRQGIEILVTCTYRSYAEQAKLYAIGRTISGKKVTNAKPGQSYHNTIKNGKPYSLAFDVVPLIEGKPMWDAKHPVWQEVGRLGKDVGLEWAGDWKRFKEYPHFQLTLKPQ